MQVRNLGSTGLQVPPIMLGGNVFGWTLNEPDSLRVLDQALDAGLNFIDTADVYSRWAPGHRGGESESIIGKWLARDGKRARVILATKVGMDMGNGNVGLAPEYIERAVDDSLKRLRTEYIDLYQSHQDDAKTPIEDTLRAYERLIEKGKIRFIGASNYTGARLREALETSRNNGLPAYQTLQPLYNLMEREPYESDLAPVAAEYGLGVLPYSSLASGFLTGKYRTEHDLEGRARARAVKKYMSARGGAVLDVLDSVAREHGATPAQVALAWLLTRPVVAAPIASATKAEHVEDLAAATTLQLSARAVERLTEASAPAT